MEIEPPPYSVFYVTPEDVLATENPPTSNPLGFQEVNSYSQLQCEQYPPPPPPYSEDWLFLLLHTEAMTPPPSPSIARHPFKGRWWLKYLPHVLFVKRTSKANTYSCQRIYACIVIWLCFYVFGFLGWMLARELGFLQNPPSISIMAFIFLIIPVVSHRVGFIVRSVKQISSNNWLLWGFYLFILFNDSGILTTCWNIERLKQITKCLTGRSTYTQQNWIGVSYYFKDFLT